MDDSRDLMAAALRAYVLQCIGCLGAEAEAEARDQTATLLGSGDDWIASLRQALGLDDGFDASVVRLWHDLRVSTDDAGFAIGPEDFARNFVERNLTEQSD